MPPISDRPGGPGGAELGKNATGSLDFAILRERYAEGGARPGFDPRKSPESIAARLKLSPATVRRRLTEWRTRGFFLGYDVLPHPALLGGRLAARILDFPNAVVQEEALEPLSLIDGVVQIQPSQNTLLVAYFVESNEQGERRLKQFRGIPGAATVGSEMSFAFPPCHRRMSYSDWRLLQAIRHRPEAKLSVLAREVGQSPKTTSRRLESLVHEAALWFDPILDTSRFPQTLAILVAYLDASESPEHLEREVRTLHPESMRAWGLSPPDSAGASGSVQLLVAAPTVAELDDLAARVAHFGGVKQVFLWHGRSTLPVRGWLDERIESLTRTSRSAR